MNKQSQYRSSNKQLTFVGLFVEGCIVGIEVGAGVTGWLVGKAVTGETEGDMLGLVVLFTQLNVPASNSTH